MVLEDITQTREKGALLVVLIGRGWPVVDVMAGPPGALEQIEAHAAAPPPPVGAGLRPVRHVHFVAEPPRSEIAEHVHARQALAVGPGEVLLLAVSPLHIDALPLLRPELV